MHIEPTSPKNILPFAKLCNKNPNNEKLKIALMIFNSMESEAINNIKQPIKK